jgi:bacterioferritin
MDYATRDILQSILQDEDRHMDDIEGIQSEIDQIGVQIFLSTQLK